MGLQIAPWGHGGELTDVELHTEQEIASMFAS
jgi:hypothetical protein